MVTRKIALGIVRRYKQAWEARNPEAIVSIFTKNGRYHEYVLKKPFLGHNDIRKYWEDKVVFTQRNIRFKLLNLYVDGNTVVAECDARFYDKIRQIGVHMRLLMLLEIKGNKISYLREYWSSEHYKNGIIVPKR